MSDGFVGAIVEAASSDDEIAESARELTTRAILAIDDILMHGTPAAQLQILKSFVPALIRAGEAKQTNEAMDVMRKEFEELRKGVREYVVDVDATQERDEMPEAVKVDEVKAEPDLPSQA